MGHLWAYRKPHVGERVNWERLNIPRPVGEWWFNEGSGLRVADVSGYEHHGALTNQAATDWQPTSRGVGLNFPDTNDVVTVTGSAPALKMTDTITVACIYKVPGTPVTCAPMSKCVNAWNWHLSIASGTQIQWRIGDNICTHTAAMSGYVNQWVLHFGTYNGASMVTGIISAVGQGSTALNRTGAIPANDNNLGLGNRTNQTLSIQSLMSAAWIWHEALPMGALERLFFGPLPIRTPVAQRLNITVGGTAYTLNLTDTLGMGESLHKGAGLTLTDSLGMGDLAGKGASANLTDSLGLSDAIARAAGKALVDQVGLSELLNRATARALTDTWAASDTVSKEAGRSFADTVALSDTITTLKVLLLALTDSLAMTDTVSRAAAVTYAETLGLSDTLSKLVGVTFADLLALADSILAYNPSTSTTARVTLAITLARTIIDATLSRLTLDIRQDEV